MAAAQGATLRELMERMGHSSTRAALIYIAGGWHEVPHIGDATGTPQGTRLLALGNKQRIKSLTGESGRRESNPHDQLGRSVWVRPARRADTYLLVTSVR